jgi:tetratricopeptide (TPR) repeat protein
MRFRLVALLWLLPLTYLRAAQQSRAGQESFHADQSLLDEGRRLYRTGNYSGAREKFTAALRHAEEFDKESPQVAEILDLLGTAFEEVGQGANAERLYKRSILITERTLGAESTDTATLLSHLGALYVQTGRPAKGEPLLLRALAINQRQGANAMSMAQVLELVGNLYLSRGKLTEAEGYYRQALEIFNRHSEQVSAAVVLANLAHLSIKTGRDPEALSYAKESMSILNRLSNPPPPSLVSTLSVLGALYARSNHLDQAEAYLRKAMRISQNTYGMESPRTAHIMQDYASVLRRLNRKPEAAALEKHAILILKDNASANGYGGVVDISRGHPR